MNPIKRNEETERSKKKLTTYLIEAANCFCWDVNNKKIYIRNTENNDDNGDNNYNDNNDNNNNNSRSSDDISCKSNDNDKGDHKSNDNNNNKEKIHQ